MKYIITLFLLVTLVACAPMMTYEEMSSAHDASIIPEEKQILAKRIEIFENNAEKARIYFEKRDACEKNGEMIWYCSNMQSIKVRRIKDIDGLVRAYRKEFQSCRCYTERSVMEGIDNIFNN